MTNMEISSTSRWVANGPDLLVIKYHAYLYNSHQYHTKERDNSRCTQNSGVSIVAKTMQISSAKDKNPIVSNMTYYGVIKEIWEVDYVMFRMLMFKCDWVESNNGVKVDELGFTLVDLSRLGYKSEPFILASQAKQVFYIEDPSDCRWSVVLLASEREYNDCANHNDVDETNVEQNIYLPSIETFDVTTDTTYVRADCDGVWIDHANNET